MQNQNYIKRAIQLAQSNVENGGGPFGALIVKNNKIVAEGVNRVTQLNDPTAHAEVQAIRQACTKLKTFNLSGCEIYTSCEPCPMCFSAIYWARLDKVYFAATHADASNVGFDDSFIYNEIKLPFNQRKIPFEELKHELKLVPFNDWDEHESKIEY